MKSYIYPLFIMLLGLLAAYLFYAIWHSEPLNPPKIVVKQQEKTQEDLSAKATIPKVLPAKHEITVESVKETEKPSDEKIEIEEAPVANLTPEQMQAKTEALYEKLTPEEHEETMQAAAEAFEELDTIVEEQDAQLAEEMQSVEASEELGDEVDAQEQDQEQISDMYVPENDEEIDMENEDGNNPQ